MIRETSLEAYKEIRRNGLLKKRQLEVYTALFERGPSTATEIFYALSKSRNPSHSNVTTRLGELRDKGVVREVQKRRCTVTGKMVIEWETTNRLPIKFEKPHRETCKTCGGKGFVETQQTRLL